jgi:hypothetical protein
LDAGNFYIFFISVLVNVIDINTHRNRLHSISTIWMRLAGLALAVINITASASPGATRPGADAPGLAIGRFGRP